MASSPTAGQTQTLIPPGFLGLDIPTQRRYAFSLGILLQAIKISDLVLPAFSLLVSKEHSQSSSYYFYKWLIIDAIYVVCLPRLRIPKLSFAWQASCLQTLLLWAVNFVLFGPWSVGLFASLSGFQAWYGSTELVGLRGAHVRIQKVIDKGDHLQGQYTVVMAPVNSIQLNPQGDSFCISSTSPLAQIPILFNNTLPQNIQFKRITPEGDTTFEAINSKLLDPFNPYALDDLDDPNQDEECSERLDPYPLKSTELLRLYKVRKLGTFTVEGAGDARIRSGSARVVQCPTASFAKKKRKKSVVCEGDGEDTSIIVTGTPPLSLDYFVETRGGKRRVTINGIQNEGDKLDGLAQRITVPLSIKYNDIGTHTYRLDAITDGLGNVVQLGDLKEMEEMEVIARPSFHFQASVTGQPVPLLLGPVPETKLPITSLNLDIQRSNWTLEILNRETGHKETVSTKTSTSTLLVYSARRPGTYEIIGARGDYCQGTILSPETWRVVEQPLPQVNISWRELHECAIDTGIVASLLFSGKPPFVLTYKEKYESQPWVTKKADFRDSRGEILLQPEERGRYQYLFTRISDHFYKDVEVVGAERIEQTVRPLASATFVSMGAVRKNPRKIISCGGDFVDVEAELKGTSPWNLELQVSSMMRSQNFEFLNLRKNREKLTLQIPHEIQSEGGSFEVYLVSVQDAQGCKRSLNIPGLTVHIPQVKVTAKFYGGTHNRALTTLEGQPAHLPLRLTGQGPWYLKYYLKESTSEIQMTDLFEPNGNLLVTKPGTYVLHEVHDDYCPGSIVMNESTYSVSWVPRPSVSLANNETLELTGTHIIKRAICQGRSDYVDLELTGKPPFQLRGSVDLLHSNGERKFLKHIVLDSIQRRTTLELSTSIAGQLLYHFDRMGDTSYPLAITGAALKPSKSISELSFRQEVLPRPRAYFKTTDHLTYCLHDKFRAEDLGAHSGVIQLLGRSPFYLDLSLHNLATGETKRDRIQLLQNEWRVELPDYRFETVGSYMLVIDSVKDASSCEQEENVFGTNSLFIDVAETAAIVPFERREEYCVGEILRFQLEGAPPWVIHYALNDKALQTLVKEPYFHRVADSAGTFSVRSLAHQSNKCRTEVNNIRYTIRDIPSARVSEGMKRIREGEQAEILFTLTGEPPFTFTYQRTELDASKKNAPPRVLESHTIAGVQTREYSIFTSQAGTWTVTYIADRHCKYPVTPQERTSDTLR